MGSGENSHNITVIRGQRLRSDMLVEILITQDSLAAFNFGGYAPTGFVVSDWLHETARNLSRQAHRIKHCV